MATAEPTTWQWIQGLLEPGQMLWMAIKSYLHVSFEAVFHEGRILAPLLDTQRLRDEAFGRFWVAFSTPPPSQSPKTPQTPLLQTPEQIEHPQQPQQPQRITGSADLIPPLLATAQGITLDLGPGTGTQIPHLRSPAITALYGIEPCHKLHPTLRARAVAEGLGEKYTIVGCSAAPHELVPALERVGIVSGGVDTILCVRVLCSVPELEDTVQGLYGLLKPGGRMIVVEHVVSSWGFGDRKGSVVARLLQGLYEVLGWRWFVGDCALTRDTERALRGAADRDGGWQSVELERYFEGCIMPYVAGVLVKKGAGPAAVSNGFGTGVGVEGGGGLKERG